MDSERVEGCNKKHNEMETPGMLSRSESHRSVGTMLSAIDQGVSQPFVGPKSCNETPISKFSGSNSNSNSNAKRSTFWGRNNNVSLVWFTKMQK